MGARTRRVLSTAGYLAFLLVTVELALQAFYYVTAGGFLPARASVPIWAPNEWSGVFNRPKLAYRHRTREFDAMNYTNDQGLRVAEGGGSYALDPPPDTTRILLLGPSFAFGWGVDYEASAGHLLEGLLESGGFGGAERVQLINAGVSSLGAGPHLNWFRHEGRKFQPDLVIHFIFGSMAVTNRERSPHGVTPEGYLIDSNASPLRKLRERAKSSAIVFYSWILYTRLDTTFGDPEEPDAIHGAGREMRAQRDFSLDNPSVIDSLDFYRALREETRRSDADVLVVFFPLSYAIHAEDESRWRHLGVRDVAAQQEFDAALCEHLTERESIPCLDISEPLQRAAVESAERLYYWLDVHWTEAGNRVAAEAVADHLLRAAP